MKAFNTVFVAGYQNSLDGHWQEVWHSETKNSYWVEQTNWNYPNCSDWVETLNTLIQSLQGPIVLITHSLGGSTVAEWCKKHPESTSNVLGAFMVAVPDVLRSDFPQQISGYESPPSQKLPFPSIALASTNDPYSNFDRAEMFAQQWGSELINLGDLEHISNRNLVDWPQGKVLLQDFLKVLNHS